MNKNLSIIALGVAVVAFVISAVLLINVNKQHDVVTGSIDGESGYVATSTYSIVGTVGANKVIKNGFGVLGSVVITNSTAGSFNLYDATTTSSHTDYATSSALIANISASLAAGAYPFDVVFNRGLLIEYQSANVASSTITYK